MNARLNKDGFWPQCFAVMKRRRQYESGRGKRRVCQQAGALACGQSTAVSRILVVDDDEAVRTLEVCVLRQLGCEVLEAEAPAEAMRFAAASPTIDLLVTDFSMPGGNGLELARRFRALHPETPVLIVSGTPEAIDSQPCDWGRYVLLPKPFTCEELEGQVRALLSGPTTTRGSFLAERSRTLGA